MAGPPPVLADRYRLAEAIGRGGMADVYAAEDTHSGRRVAVKVMRVGDAADPERFAAEMRILERLSHPAIVPLFDTGHTADDSPYFVMQLVEGESLSTRLREEGPMPEPDLVKVARRVAGALAHAHERGVVHRDIKPANILIDDAGRGFLTDFGVARLIDSTLVTRSGTTIGTAAYLAPEQLQDSAVGPGADVYSLALVLIEAFTGRRAFRGTGIEAAMARMGRDPAIPEDLPDNWRGLLLTMTRRDPSRRPSAAVVEAVMRGRQPPPPLDPDELAARAIPPVPGDDAPTAVTPLAGAEGSGAWDPPSGGSGSASLPAVLPPGPGGSEALPTPALALALTPAPVLGSAGGGALEVERTDEGVDEGADEGEVGGEVGGAADLTPTAPDPTAPDSTAPASGRGLTSVTADGSAAEPAPGSEPAPPRGFDAIRSRALVVGAVLGAVVVLLLVGLTLSFDDGDEDPVVGDAPVDDATRVLLDVLAASEILRASDPSLARDLRVLSQGIVVAVNEDRWDAALQGVIDSGEVARVGIERFDIDPVALTGLIEALRTLTEEIEAVIDADAGEEGDGDGP